MDIGGFPAAQSGAGARVVRMQSVAQSEAVCVQVIDPYHTPQSDWAPASAVAHRGVMAPGDTVEIEHPGPLGLVAVAAAWCASGRCRAPGVAAAGGRPQTRHGVVS